VRSFAVVVLSVGLLFLAAYPSQAVPIIDTGTPPDPTQGQSLLDIQWIGGEFTTAETFEITSVEGYIVDRFVSGSFTVGLYSGGGEVPGTELFSGAATAIGGANWYGLTGLNHVLLPGTYWVTFEVRPGDTLHGYMPSAVAGPGTGAPNPLANEALFLSGAWVEFDGIEFGVRIFGNRVDGAAPEPSGIILLALGLGLTIRRFRRPA
jgi:hypothetical protein